MPAKPDGTLYGLTPDGNAKLHFYRRDLMEAAGIQQSARHLARGDRGGQGAARSRQRPSFGFITTNRRGGFAGWVFWGMLASYGGDWFDKQAEGGWHPTFNNDKGFKALETLVELMKYRHPVTLNGHGR